MKIERPQPHQLMIRDRPWFVPAFGGLFFVVGSIQGVRALISGEADTNLIFGTSVAILLGGGMALYAARRSDYLFDSQTRVFSWRRRRPFYLHQGHMSFDDIERAVLHRGPASDDTTTCVVLYTKDGEFPLMIGYSAGEKGHREVTAAINEMLEQVAV